jgi:carboxypeptidase Q
MRSPLVVRPAAGLLFLSSLGACAPRASTVSEPAVIRAAPERVDADVNRRIREEGLQRSRVMRTALMLSDVLGPRLAGSPEYRQAAEWARRELESYGLSNAALEPWGKRRGASWVVEESSLEMTSPRYARLVAYPRAWSASTAGVVRGVPVIASMRSEAELAAHKGKLRGAILLNGRPRPDQRRFSPLATRFTDAELDSMARITNPGSPRDYWEDAGDYAASVRERQRVFELLREEGVAVVLEPSGIAGPVRVSAFQAYDTDASRYAPAMVVASADYARLVNMIDAGSAPTLEVELRTRAVPDDSTGYNVVAELAGSDSALRDEVVMVGGHFDSWPAGTGATDNAAGVAVSMEAVRILSAIGARPRRTIRVALWDGEEHEEYFGSMGYVRKHFGDPETMRLLPAHERISAYYNVDSGTGRIRGLFLQGNGAARGILSAYLAPFRNLGASTVTLANTGGTDIMPFVSVGIPAFNFLQDPIDYETWTHHTSLDVGTALIEEDLKQAAVVVASVVYHTANRRERMPRPALPSARSEASR